MPVPDPTPRIQSVARGVRRRVLEQTIENGGGYLSQACSAAEILATLYCDVMALAPVATPVIPRPFAGVPSKGNPGYRLGHDCNGPRQRVGDRFYLSPTHYSLPLYATLIETGRLAEGSLGQFNRDGSSLEMIGAEHSPGMEVMTGSLGQGLGQAIGVALGRHLKQEPGRTWVFMSDGEFQIGMVWESFEFMAHHEVETVGVFVDVNGQQCDGAVNSVMKLGPLAAKLGAFGAEVATVDGHDVDALRAAARTPHPGKPLVVLCRTDPCRGVPELKNNAGKLHYLRIKNDIERRRYQAVLDALAAEAC